MGNVLHWFGSAVTYAEATDPTWRTLEGWIYYPLLMPRQFGWIITSLSIGGVIYRISSRELEDSEKLLLVTIAFVYLLHVFLSNKDPRYVMLYAPLFCVFAGTAAVSGAEAMRNYLGRDSIAVRGTLTVLLVLSVVTSGIVLVESNNSQYPNSGIRDASEIATSLEPGLIVVHGQSDSVSVNAISFYVASNDPELEFSVYWFDRVNKSQWIISSTPLSREGWALHSTIEKDQTVYLYNRTRQ